MKTPSKEEIEELADELIDWFKDENNIFLKNFAVHKGFPARKISEYANKNKYFEEKLALAKDIQESRLVDKGLGKKVISNNGDSNKVSPNKVSSNFIIFMLKNIAGWRERFADEKKEKNSASIKLVLKESKPGKHSRKSKENKDQLNIFDDDENSE